MERRFHFFQPHLCIPGPNPILFSITTEFGYKLSGAHQTCFLTNGTEGHATHT